MDRKDFKYIYGPVASWRLGSSLGIDAISGKEKICTFDCVYCQLGRTGILSSQRRVFVPADEIIRELVSLPFLKIDYITFSGSGEPTLAKNLGRIIKAIKKIRKVKIAVLTNASLIGRKDVRDFKGRLALQIMFIKENKKYARGIARLARQIHPDEIHINTCLRPCGVRPLSRSELRVVKNCFLHACVKDTKILSVYECPEKEVKAISKHATLKRRGKG
jgi:wyosine [tRNA(Phe)-imidazoG37] synthetase (radical SAM superfamily)